MRRDHDEPRAEVRIHLAQIRPDVSMKDLLKKTQKVEQIFTVFGQPRTRVTVKAEELVVHMDGVDVYDPVQNALQATTAGKVAVRSDRLSLGTPAAGQLDATVSAIEYQGSQVQVHLVGEGRHDLTDDDSPDRGAWVALLADADFHARPFEPGQRVAMRWPEAEAHPLAA